MVGQDLSNLLSNADLVIVPIVYDLNTIVMGDQPNLSFNVYLGSQELEQFPQRVLIETRDHEVIDLTTD
jgi:hypothetical protein